MAIVATTIVVSLLWPALAADFALPLAILAVLVGIPHGAADGALLATAEPAAGRRAAWLYFVVFLALGVAVWLAPVPTVLVLLVLSVVHFGLGEVEYREAAPAQRLSSPARSLRSWRRGVAVFGYGGVVVAVPFAVHPQPVDMVLRALNPELVTALPPVVRWTVATAAVLCLLGTVVVEIRSRHLQPAAEGVLLLVLAAVAPPVLTFAVFFGAWHSLRHLTRLLLPRTVEPDRNAGVLTADRVDLRLVVTSATGSVVVVAAAAVALAWLGLSTVHLLAVLVAGLLALTVPHAAVVAWFDARPATARS